MRRLLLYLIILTTLLSCSAKTHESEKIALPDSILVNDVIASIIKLDSIWIDHNVKSDIKPLNLYKQKYVNNDSSLQVPQPNEFSVSYDDLFTFFGSKKNLNIRFKDSVYAARQVDLSKDYYLSDTIKAHFNKNDNSFYVFYLPIFSHDKSLVYTLYARECGPLCGTFFEIVLKRENGHWVKTYGKIIGGR